MTESFYDVLGVPETADQEEITAAYREKVKEYHPDVSDRDDAAERFKAVTRAEEVLGDETERVRYDRLGHDAYVRHLDGANAAGNERSPWTNAGGGGGNGETDSAGSTTGSSAGGSGATGTSSTRERARSAAGAGDEYESSQHRKQRRRRRAHERRADASWTVGGEGQERSGRGGKTGATAGSTSSADAGRTASNARTGGTASSAGTDGGAASGNSAYTVHEWEATDRSFIGDRPSLTRNELVQTVILGLLYPALLYSSVTPAFSLLINLVVAALTLLLIGYLLTVPLVGGTVFCVWSVLAPLAVASMGYDLVSVPMIVAALGCWIPLGYSITVAYVLRW
mgnify:CR=1 FL=1